MGKEVCDVTKGENGECIEHVNSTDMEIIKDYIQEIYNKNNMPINVEIISYDEAQKYTDKTKQGATDAYLKFTNNNDWSGYGNTSPNYDATVDVDRTGVSLGAVKYMMENSKNYSQEWEGRDMLYFYAWAGSHEVLHQYLYKASKTVNNTSWGTDGGHTHLNVHPCNLNTEGTWVFPNIPKTSSNKLSCAEVILPIHKDIIFKYFNLVHEKQNPDLHRHFIR